MLHGRLQVSAPKINVKYILTTDWQLNTVFSKVASRTQMLK